MKSPLRAMQERWHSIYEVFRYFQNPCLAVFLRLGIIKLPYFLYSVQAGGRGYKMLGRPTTTSIADISVLKEVLVEESYGDVLQHVPSGPLRIVDIGANIGAFTVWLHYRHGVREAFCFEPEPDSKKLLDFNVATNGCAFAKTSPDAVGGHSRTVTIKPQESCPARTNIYGKQLEGTIVGDGVPVQVIVFQKWLDSILGSFDVLKLDCEGAEWEIIETTDSAHLGRFPVVIAEVHADPDGKHEIHDFKSLMEQRGFTTKRWDGTAPGLYLGVHSVQ